MLPATSTPDIKNWFTDCRHSNSPWNTISCSAGNVSASIIQEFAGKQFQIQNFSTYLALKNNNSISAIKQTHIIINLDSDIQWNKPQISQVTIPTHNLSYNDNFSNFYLKIYPSNFTLEICWSIFNFKNKVTFFSFFRKIKFPFMQNLFMHVPCSCSLSLSNSIQTPIFLSI